MKIKGYGIFEGGGAKGLAHIGALAAAEKYGVQFEGVAGSSAGSIVAALVAVGYKANDLFDSLNDNNQRVFDADFVALLGKKRWWFIAAIRKFRNWCQRNPRLGTFLFLSAIFALALAITVLLMGYGTAYWYFEAHEAPLIASILVFISVLVLLFTIFLVDRFSPWGLFSTAKFEGWINEKLREKLFPNEPERRVLFRDIETPLKILATDIVSREPIVFSKDKDPEVQVARAISHSIAIPFAFQPSTDSGRILVDGGVLSNFPAWVFDDERDAARELIFTFGFRLEDDGSQRAKSISSSISYYCKSLVSVFFGDNSLQFRAIDDLHLVRIKVSSHTLDFDMDRGRRKALFNEGFVAAMASFEQFQGPKHVSLISFYLKTLHDEFLSLIGKPGIHLRVNLALPIAPKNEKLRILYSFNMDDDADDRLTLRTDEGSIGECWQTREPVYVDMVQASKHHLPRWKMTKYQQALVRKSLKSLVSVPVFADGAIDTCKTNSILAILSLDSDHDLRDEFSKIRWDINSDVAELVKSSIDNIAEELKR